MNREPETATARTFAFVSLGCPKNLVDSERMLGKLAQDGYALTPDADGADVVVINTCGFIEPARQESLAVIREMLALKEQGRSAPSSSPAASPSARRTTCSRKCPSVDHIVGVFGREEIAPGRAIARAVAQRATSSAACSARPRCAPRKTRPACASRRGTTPI